MTKELNNCLNCVMFLDHACTLPSDEIMILPGNDFIKKASLKCVFYLPNKKEGKENG